MKPDIPRTSLPGLYLLGLFNALKAAAMVAFADGLANSIMTVINGGSGWQSSISGPLTLAAAAILLRAAMVWAVNVTAKRTALGAKEELRAELSRNWLRRAGSNTAESNGGASVLASKGIDALDGYYTQYLPALVSAATVPLIIGARILAADWVSALIIVLTVPLIPLFMALIGWFTEEKVSAATGALLRLSNQLAELARGLPVLIGLRRAKEQRAALDKLGDDYRRTTMATLRVAFLSALALELIATLSVALVAVFIGVRLVYGQIDLSIGLLVLILVADCYLPFRELGAAFHASDDGREAMRRSRAELDAPLPKPLPQASADPKDLDAKLPEFGLAVTGLSAKYRDRSVAALTDIDLRVPPGALCAIAGPSGCGKSTLLGILAGTVTSVDAELSGQVQGIDPQRLAWLPQSPGSTENTVAAELLLWGATDRAAVSSLLDDVELSGREEQHPASLSPGQLRRLAMARILLRVDAGANTVLVDEPTAHVDADSARLIEDALISLRGRATVLLVSHDRRVLALADQWLELAAPEAPKQPAIDHAQGANELGKNELTRNDLASAVLQQANSHQANLHQISSHSSGTSELSDAALSDAATAGITPHRQSSIKTFWQILQPWRPAMIGSVFFGVLAALAALALTALSGWLIVRASQQPPVLYLLTAIVGVRFFGLLRAVARYVERLCTHETVFAASDRLRGQLWDALARTLPARRELSRGDSVLPRLIGDVDALRELAPRVMLPPINAFLAGVAVLISTWLLLPQALGFQAIIIACAVLICPLLALWADRRATRQAQRQRNKLFGNLTALLGSAAELRTNRVEGPLLTRMSALDRSATAAAQRGAWAEGLAMAVLTGFACAASLGMLVIGAPSVATGDLPTEVLVALVLLQLGLIDAFAPLVQSAPGLPLLVKMLRALGQQLRVPALPEIPLAEPGIAVRAEALAIGWQGLTVAKNLNVELRAGDWLTVTGPSGAGKSTFLATLMGFTAPRAGELGLRGNIAWCPQEAHLFNSTLRGNLSLARAKSDAPSPAEMTKALADVGLSDWFDELSLGLDTPIGASGSLVSGGQRQRIAVARALLTRADVVLLDEPTAHLDAAAANNLMKDLRKSLATKTVVLITHHDGDIAVDDLLLKLDGSGRATTVVNDSVGV